MQGLRIRFIGPSYKICRAFEYDAWKASISEWWNLRLLHWQIHRGGICVYCIGRFTVVEFASIALADSQWWNFATSALADSQIQVELCYECIGRFAEPKLCYDCIGSFNESVNNALTDTQIILKVCSAMMAALRRRGDVWGSQQNMYRIEWSPG